MLPIPIQKIHIPHGTRVLVRTSLNVPIQDGEVLSMFRLHSALETIRFLRSIKARITLISHLSDSRGSLAPVHQILNRFIPVSFIPQITGEAPYAARKNLQPGEIVLLENVRSDHREQESDDLFAEEIAANADMFVFDDFTAAHRSHASTVNLIRHLPSYAGIQFYKEVTAAMRITERLRKPAVAVLGGAKCSTKLPLIAKLSETYDALCVGGVLANTLLKHRGYEVGLSKVEEVEIPEVLAKKTNVLLPQDVIVTKDFLNIRTVPIDSIGKDETIVDIGDQTLKIIQHHLNNAKTVFMNGPTGWYEKGFTHQTATLANMVVNTNAYTLAGGGDIVALLEKVDMIKKLHFVSTGGGALLQYLAEGTLPVLQVFEEKAKEKTQ